jgi:hypothetical protein
MKTLMLLMLTVVAGSMLRPDPTPPLDEVLSPRQKVLRVASGEVGVREKTGRNDGEVDKYLAAVDLGGSRAPYCAAFVYWVGREALGDDNPYPKSAWSPSFVARGKRVTSEFHPKGGEAFGIWFRNKGRVAHTGLIEARKGASLITIEGNTSSNAAVGSASDREGHGVYRKRRHLRTVHNYRDWLHPLEPG